MHCVFVCYHHYWKIFNLLIFFPWVFVCLLHYWKIFNLLTSFNNFNFWTLLFEKIDPFFGQLITPQILKTWKFPLNLKIGKKMANFVCPKKRYTVHPWVFVCLPSFVCHFGSYDLARGKVGPFSVLNIRTE